MAIASCVKSGDWQRALDLIAGMKVEGVSPDVSSYNGAISACAKAGQWRIGLELLAKVCVRFYAFCFPYDSVLTSPDQAVHPVMPKTAEFDFRWLLWAFVDADLSSQYLFMQCTTHPLVEVCFTRLCSILQSRFRWHDDALLILAFERYML